MTAQASEAQLEANKRYIHKRMQAGICLRCTAPVHNDGKKAYRSCLKHLEEARARYHRGKETA